MVREISTLDSLRQLRIGECGLSEVPSEFKKLELLEELYVFGNPLSEIPDWLPAMPNLKRLGLVDAMDDETKSHLRIRHPQLEIW